MSKSRPRSKKYTRREHRRVFPGEGDDGQRSRFERDRDAILYTTAFRRLAGVTQVVTPGEGHIFHNRLTHTLEVAQIALRLAEHLVHPDTSKRTPGEYTRRITAYGGLDASAVEAAALAHDLGHPPFGHIAEHTLNKLIFKEGVVDGYEGNAQAFRIITSLSVRTEVIPGLNLTRAVLNAVLKYPCLQSSITVKDKTTGKDITKQEHKKWSVYSTEKEDFDFARELQQPKRESHQSLEAQLMDWADDIAYSISDTEDFFRSGHIPLDRIFEDDDGVRRFLDDVFQRWHDVDIYDKKTREYPEDELRKAFTDLYSQLPYFERPYDDSPRTRATLRRITSQLIGRYIQGTGLLAKPDDKGNYLDIPRHFKAEVVMLKELTWQYVIKNSALAGQQLGQQKIIEKLFAIYLDALSSNDADDWGILPARDRHERMKLKNSHGQSVTKPMLIRLVADAIAGMTDQQAILMYQRLTGASLGGAFEAWAR